MHNFTWLDAKSTACATPTSLSTGECIRKNIYQEMHLALYLHMCVTYFWRIPPGLTKTVCVCSVWVPCVALSSGGGSSVGPSHLRGSPVWVPCMGPLCGSPVWVPRPVAFHVACGIYSRDASRSCSRSRIQTSTAHATPTLPSTGQRETGPTHKHTTRTIPNDHTNRSM